MKVSELGEFGLIERLARVVSGGWKPEQLVLGIGDDAAAWRSDGSTLLATTDALVEGVHFTPETPMRDLGWKAMASNLSDIAAMGGIPQFALISLSLPGDTEVDNVTQLYHGVAEAADQFRMSIIGGNISSAPLMVINLTVLGVALSEGMLTRSAAAPGDLVATTGYLGSSAAGLRMLTQHLKFAEETGLLIRNAHLRPQPRIPEGQFLVRKGVRAAIDISDGLIADLGHLCKASGVGALVKTNQVPVHPIVRQSFPEDALSFALAGGEDYELLFTAGKDTIDDIKRSADFSINVIGEITQKAGIILIDEEGRPFTIDKKGWDHFIKGGRSAKNPGTC